MRGKWALFGGIVILVAAAAGALSLWKRETPKTVITQAPAAPVGPPPGADLSLTGKIEAREVVGIQAPSAGVIEEYLVAIGEEVFEGQLLARIANPGLQASQEQAKQEADRAQDRVNALESQMLAARLDVSRGRAEIARVQDEYVRAERAKQRQEMLNKEGATPRLTYEKAIKEFNTAKLEFDSANGRVKVAESRVEELLKEIEAAKKLLDDKNAALEEADNSLQATQIHAPVDGIVISRKGEPGVHVQLGEDDVLRIGTDLGLLQVVLEPEPLVLSKLKQGQPASVFLAENAGEALNGEINRIDNGKVYVYFGSPDPSVKPGLTAQVKVTLP
jgi:multidrug resistance efflux pump